MDLPIIESPEIVGTLLVFCEDYASASGNGDIVGAVDVSAIAEKWVHIGFSLFIYFVQRQACE
jgi:hypothetical protein